MRSIFPVMTWTLASASPRSVHRKQGVCSRPKRGSFQLQAWFVGANQGASLSRHKVDGAELLLVDDGVVRAIVHSGVIDSLSQNGSMTHYEGAFDVQTGESISANFGALVSYMVNDQKPARFWLFSLTPVE